MHSKHLQRPGSYSFHRAKETFPVQVLGAPTTPINLPGVGDARPSLHIPQDNLGAKRKGVTCRVGRHSRGSLHRESFQAQEQDKSLPESTPLWQLASEEGTGQTNLSESNLPWQQALEEGTRQKIQEQVPPPTQLWQFTLQLRNEIVKLHQVVGNLAGLLDSQLRNHSLDAKLSKEKGEPTISNNNNNNENNNNNNNTNNTSNTNNNKDDNNNDNDNDKISRESSLRSLDLDNDNPESNLSGSETDLDASSLGVESGLGSSDQQTLSLENLGSPKEESSDSFDQEGEP